jgi:hypothetical protein
MSRDSANFHLEILMDGKEKTEMVVLLITHLNALQFALVWRIMLKYTATV